MNLNEYFTKTNRKKSEFAHAIGVSPALLNQWLSDTRPVAAQHCQAIVSESSGEVSLQDLRPDDWSRIWPDVPHIVQAIDRRKTPQTPQQIRETAPPVMRGPAPAVEKVKVTP